MQRICSSSLLGVTAELELQEDAAAVLTLAGTEVDEFILFVNGVILFVRVGFVSGVDSTASAIVLAVTVFLDCSCVFSKCFSVFFVAKRFRQSSFRCTSNLFFHSCSDRCSRTRICWAIDERFVLSNSASFKAGIFCIRLTFSRLPMPLFRDSLALLSAIRAIASLLLW